MKIKMDVELVSERCVDCKDLEIDVITTATTGIDAYSDDPEVARNAFQCTNELRCAHFQECKWRFDHLMPEKKAEIKVLEKPVKKQATKKSPAKKPVTTEKPKTKAKAAAKK